MLLRDTQASVRWHAIRAIKRMSRHGNPRAVDAVLLALKDSDIRVREAAVEVDHSYRQLQSRHIPVPYCVTLMSGCSLHAPHFLHILFSLHFRHLLCSLHPLRYSP